jgi:hypothetical protein
MVWLKPRPGWGVAMNRDSPQRAILSPDARMCRV